MRKLETLSSADSRSRPRLLGDPSALSPSYCRRVLSVFVSASKCSLLPMVLPVTVAGTQLTPSAGSVGAPDLAKAMIALWIEFERAVLPGCAAVVQKYPKSVSCEKLLKMNGRSTMCAAP